MREEEEEGEGINTMTIERRGKGEVSWVIFPALATAGRGVSA